MSENYPLIIDYVDNMLNDIVDAESNEERGDILSKVRQLSIDWERGDCADVIIYLMGRVNNG
jgi:hypothetical protein